MTIASRDEPGLPPSMRNRVPYLLYRAAATSTTLADAGLRRVHLTARQMGILTLIIERAPMTQRELGETIGVDRTTMVTLLDDLEAKGFAERRRNPSDRRAFLIYPTKRGISAQKRGLQVLDEVADEFLKALTPEQRQHLADLLRLLEPRLR
jgi:DNA-binding MarR family transcriptional regulator